MTGLDVEALFDAHHEQVRRFFRRRIGDRDPSLADDLAAAVFLRAWERRDRYHELPGVPPIAWLMAIARNVLVDYFRSERPTVSMDVRVAFGYEPVVADITVRADVTLALRAAVLTLTPKQRAVVVGRFIGGYRQTEMTDIAPLQGVKKLQQRALVNLRKALGGAA